VTELAQTVDLPEPIVAAADDAAALVGLAALGAGSIRYRSLVI
jgi:hypothetical protein